MPTCKVCYICPHPSSSLASLRIFYNTVKSHIPVLSSLGKSEHTLGDLLILIIMENLPTDIQRNLAQKHSNSPWNLPDLMAAILKEICILESGLYSQENRIPKSTTSAFHVTSADKCPNKQDSNRKQTCMFCKKAQSRM